MAAIERRFEPARADASSAANFESLVAAQQSPPGALGASLGTSGSASLSSLASATTTPTDLMASLGLTPTTTNLAAPSRSAGSAVVNAGMIHLGVPYKWGGTDAENGFDCSGLVQDAYRRIGVDMPKWSRHQAKMGVEVDSIEEALPGDVLAFGSPVSHVGIYVGDNQMLHAPQTGEVVKIETIDRPIASIRRIVSPGASASGIRSASRFDLGAMTTASTGPVATSAAEAAYRPLFEAAGQKWNLDPNLLAAVASTESGFNPQATSPVGAQGLMQFMPATASSMGVDPWDPASAIDGAGRYLREAIDQFGSTDLAIASYNAGRGAVARYGGIPPYPETQAYVRKVNHAWETRS